MAGKTNLTVTEDRPLLQWLLATLVPPMSRTRVKELLTRGAVSVNGTATTKHDHPLKLGDRITIASPSAPKAKPLPSNISIAYEDDAILVLDKPHGLLSVATDTEKLDTAFVRLADYLNANDAGRPFVVHRLDRETSGLLLFARSAAIRDTLQVNWTDVEKTYLAVVEGRPEPQAGRIDNFLRECPDQRVRECRPTEPERKQAISVYRVLKRNKLYAIVEVILLTGRKHQIRVHMSNLGSPVIGDAVYGRAYSPAGRMGLHATRLRFPHPVTQKPITVESPLPRELHNLVG